MIKNRTIAQSFSAYGRSRPSVVCMSSVTLLHPRHILELFGNIFAPLTSSGIWTVCIEIMSKQYRGSRKGV